MTQAVPDRSAHYTLGVWYGAAAYAMWGIFPLYWQLLKHVPPLQVIGHRIVWSFVALLALALGMRGRRLLRSVSRRTLWQYGLAAVLVGINWFLYVWGVNSGLVVEASLGYFITPLMNVVIGVLVLRERLRPMQLAAVGIAAAGVAYLTAIYGAVPWLALGLAISFAAYGLVKKRGELAAMEGLTLETAVLLVPAVVFLVLEDRAGRGAFLHAGPGTDLLLAGAGIVTSSPLLLFGAAVRRVPLSVVGILQYISPTLSFLLGVFVFDEPFSRWQLAGFMLVWAAIVLFAIDGLRQRSRGVAPERARSTA